MTGIADIEWIVTPSGETYYICPICGDKFQDITKLYDHMKKGHYKEREATDENSRIYAYLVFKYGKNAKKLYSAISGLVARSSQGGVISCPICGEEVLSKEDLKFHLAKKHGDSLLDSIELKFYDKDVLGHRGYIEDALDKVTEKFKRPDGRGGFVYVCPRHKKIYRTPEEFKQHLLKFHMGDIYQWAGMESRSREDLIGTIIENTRMRFNVRQNGEEKVVYKYRCPICGKFFDDKEIYGLHLQDHDTPELVRGAEFSRRNYE